MTPEQYQPTLHDRIMSLGWVSPKDYDRIGLCDFLDSLGPDDRYTALVHILDGDGLNATSADMECAVPFLQRYRKDLLRIASANPSDPEWTTGPHGLESLEQMRRLGIRMGLVSQGDLSPNDWLGKRYTRPFYPDYLVQAADRLLGMLSRRIICRMWGLDVDTDGWEQALADFHSLSVDPVSLSEIIGVLTRQLEAMEAEALSRPGDKGLAKDIRMQRGAIILLEDPTREDEVRAMLGDDIREVSALWGEEGPIAGAGDLARAQKASGE